LTPSPAFLSGNDGDWFAVTGTILGLYAGWLLAIRGDLSKIKEPPADIILTDPLARSNYRDDLVKLRMIVLLLALIPTILLVAVPIVILLTGAIDWRELNICDVGIVVVWALYCYCAGLGWLRWIALASRINVVPST
jgi:hypothetical protein